MASPSSFAEQKQQNRIESSLMSAQTALSVVICVIFRKPRIVFCATMLTFRHKMILAQNVRIFHYFCGSDLFPPTEKRKLANAMIMRPQYYIWEAIEVPYCSGDPAQKGFLLTLLSN